MARARREGRAAPQAPRRPHAADAYGVPRGRPEADRLGLGLGLGFVARLSVFVDGVWGVVGRRRRGVSRRHRRPRDVVVFGADDERGDDRPGRRRRRRRRRRGGLSVGGGEGPRDHRRVSLPRAARIADARVAAVLFLGGGNRASAAPPPAPPPAARASVVAVVALAGPEALLGPTEGLPSRLLARSASPTDDRGAASQRGCAPADWTRARVSSAARIASRAGGGARRVIDTRHSCAVTSASVFLARRG